MAACTEEEVRAEAEEDFPDLDTLAERLAN